MMKHKHAHYEFMFECKHCEKGFHFQSQLCEHLWVHQSQGNWTCFKPKCGKRFKHESELNAHLLSHNKKKYECDQCMYSNPDPRNLRAHQCKHSDRKHLYVPNVAKVSNGCNKDIGILLQMNTLTLDLKNKCLFKPNHCNFVNK